MARAQRRRAAHSGRRRDAAEGVAQPPRGDAQSAPRPAAAAPRVQPRRRRNPFGFLRRFEPRFVADVVSELKKVTWPSFAEARYLTFVVAVVAVSVGILLGLVDLAFGWVIEQLFFT